MRSNRDSFYSVKPAVKYSLQIDLNMIQGFVIYFCYDDNNSKLLLCEIQ